MVLLAVEHVYLPVEHHHPDPHGRQELDEREPQIGEKEFQSAEQHDERTHDEAQGGEEPPGLAELDDGGFDGVLIALADRRNEPLDLLADSPAERSRSRSAIGLVGTGLRLVVLAGAGYTGGSEFRHGVIVIGHESSLCQSEVATLTFWSAAQSPHHGAGGGRPVRRVVLRESDRLDAPSHTSSGAEGTAGLVVESPRRLRTSKLTSSSTRP